jgi:uncharacterized protein
MMRLNFIENSMKYEGDKMKILKIEIADNPATLARGLMYRDKLGADQGMLFKFPAVLEASFWGKDTHIPLDIAFIAPNGKISGIKSITPMSTRTVRSDSSCAMAIEANAGFFDTNGIKVGHAVEIIKDQSGKEIEVAFKE